MLVSLLLHIKVFLFIMAIFVMVRSILHIIAVFSLKQGKLVTSEKSLTIFGVSLAYILTMLICGF